MVGAIRARTLPAGVVVRRLRGELGRACVDGLERSLAGERPLGIFGELLELSQEPRIDARPAMELVDGDFAPQRFEHVVEAVGAGRLGQLEELVEVLLRARLRVKFS